MKRFAWMVPPLALAVLVTMGTLMPSLALKAIALATGLAIVAWSPPVLLLGIPFVLVQVLGSGLRVPGLPLAVPQLSYLVVAAVALRWAFKHPRPLTSSNDRMMVAFILLTAVASAVGAAGGADWSLIKEDLAPLAFLWITYFAARVMVTTRRHVDLLIAAILVGTVLAGLKLAYLAAVPVSVSWDGPWQATRIINNGLVVRLYLRGSDVFIVAAVLLLIAQVLNRTQVTVSRVVAGIMSIWAIVVSGTRSNMVGLIVGALAMVFGGVTISGARMRRLVVSAVVGLLLVILAIAVVPSLRETAFRVWTQAESRSWTLAFRELESRGVLDEVSAQHGIGGGLGATFVYFDLERKTLVRTNWTHNGLLMVLLKLGVQGLILFGWIMGRSLVDARTLIRARHEWAPQVMGFAAVIIAILTLSVPINKIFDHSGAMLLGLALAVIQTAVDDFRVERR